MDAAKRNDKKNGCIVRAKIPCEKALDFSDFAFPESIQWLPSGNGERRLMDIVIGHKWYMIHGQAKSA